MIPASTSPNPIDFPSDVIDGCDKCCHSSTKSCYSRHKLTIRLVIFFFRNEAYHVGYKLTVS